MRLVLALALIVLAGGITLAGTISLVWEPLRDPTVTGYRVYYGRDPTAMASDFDAGPVAETTIEGLADCTTWHLSVRAYNGYGFESSEPSRIVKGWPRPVVTASQPRSISPGETALLTVTGTNFDPGVPGDPLHPGATIEFSHPGLRVLELFYDACRQLRVRVEAVPDAEPGWSALTVENVDASWDDPMSQPKVFGTLEQALEVLAPPSNDPPSVAGCSPAPGTVGVPLSVRPSIVFSESVDPTSVTALTVRLLDEGGAGVAQAAGSPSVRGAEVTLLPAAPLRAGTAYRIEAAGGPDGVKDLTGLPLTTDWRLDPAFTTAANDPPSVAGSSPAPGAVGVPLSVRPSIVFSESVDPTSVTALTVRLLDEGGAGVAQAAGSPSVRGAEVTLLPAAPLRAGTAHRIEAAGGPDGVKDLTGLPLTTGWRLDPAFTTAAADTNPTAVIVDSQPVAGQRGVSVASREVRVRFDRDMRPLATVAGAGALQKVFRVLSGQKVLAQAPGSPAFEDDGQSIVIRLRAPLQAGLRYATVVDLTGPKLRAALERSGHAELAMTRTWVTSPQWETMEALVAAEARSAGSETGIPLVIGGSSPAPQNATVPITSEFRLTFAEPLLEASVNPSTIRILAGGKPLMLASRPEREADQRTVVLRAARPLAPGTLHKIQVRGGPKGVKFQVAGGGAAPIGAPRAIYVHFATEVPAATQSQSLELGE